MVLMMTSCSDWLDVNDDPNNPTDVPPELILPSAQVQIAGTVNGYYSILGGIWSQHWTQSHVASQYRNEDRYDLPASDRSYNNAWSDIYSDALVDLQSVRSSALENEEWNSYLQATLLMAYTYQILVDFYDQIPFSEALQGIDGISEPKFDAGQDVYDGLISMIDDAMGRDFSASSVKLVSTDYVFGNGNLAYQIERWMQFGNTLKLKIYLRQSEARPSVAESGIAALYNAGANFLVESASIDAYSDSPDASYPLFETDRRQLNVTSNLRASLTMTSFLMEMNDPRIDVLFVPGSNGQYGLQQGNFNLTTAELAGDIPSVANIVPDESFYFFTLDEVYFMLSEAALRYGQGSARDFYDMAVTEAFSRLGLNVGGLIQSGGVYEYPNGSMEANMNMIMTQKWVSSIERGYTSFFDQNRTGIPQISSSNYEDPSYVPGQLVYSYEGTTSGMFPKRLVFPDRTRRVNTNTPTEVPLTQAVWWDK